MPFKNTTKRLLFLAWGCPWPAHNGGDLRTLGLLKELSKVYEVELLLLLLEPLSAQQVKVLNNYSKSLLQVPAKNITISDKILLVKSMFYSRIPYHCAVLRQSFQTYPEILERIQNYPGVVFASHGHWGTLTGDQQFQNWILDQMDADIDVWRVYASQTSKPLMKLAALINWRLADRHFRLIYRNVGHIISVCEEDKQLTLAIDPTVRVLVISNGVDCSYYNTPDRKQKTGPPRLLFTGNHAARNMTALKAFVRDIFPQIQRELPDVELLVGGNFNNKAQAEFKKYHSVRFTGRVDDIRPVFNQSDVFVAPFEETHGSKLKIAEAMAMGMAIVSTPEGIRGFPLVDGKSVLVAYNDEQFASLAASLLTDPIRRKKIGTQARQFAEVYLDWKVLGNRLTERVNSVYESFEDTKKIQ